MDFKKATDTLFDGATHSDLAKELGVSVASIRQARLASTAKAYRSPPDRWRAAVAAVAEKRGRRLMRLAEQLRG